MKVRVRCAVACLVLITFTNCHALACVTADTDLGGGGWETSAAADPCTGGQTGHGALVSSRQSADTQASGTNVAVAQKYLSPWSDCGSFTGRSILAILVMLLPANRLVTTGIHHDLLGIGSNASVTQVNI